MLRGLLNNNIQKIGTVSDLRTPMLNYSTLFFTIGMLFDLVSYVQNGKMLLFLLNGVGILTIPLIWLLYQLGKLDANKAVIFHVWAIALNLYLSIFTEAFYPGADREKNILLIMSVCIIPTILAGMTTVRFMPLLVASGAIVCYSFVGFYMQDTMILQSIPVLSLVLMGASVALWHLLDISRQTERKNMKVLYEEEQLIRFFNLAPEQWQMIKEGKLTKEQSEKLLAKLENKTRKKLIFQLKELLQDEVEIKSILKEAHPTLTSSELQLCCYILDGLSVSEISKIRDVGISTITSTRSRLRTKLDLKPSDSLKDSLEILVRKHIY